MAFILDKLDVPRSVRLFFEPFFHVMADGALMFDFGDEAEHFGHGFHRVPLAVTPWIAGSGALLFYSFSAMDAISFLSRQAQRFPDFSLLKFVALGARISELPQYNFVKRSLLFSNDLLGRLTDIKVASALSGHPVAIRYHNGDLAFETANSSFRLNEATLSLSGFEKAAGIRSGIRTYKPHSGFENFTQQLIKNTPYG